MVTRSRLAAFVASLSLVMATTSAPAWAAEGYELDATKSTIDLAGENPHGIAIDQTDQRIYVTIGSTNMSSFAPGNVEQLEPNGSPTAASPFSAGGTGDIFTGVAVNPVTHGIYASESRIATPLGTFGEMKMNTFSAAGVPGSSFALSGLVDAGPQIAVDSGGSVYFPNDSTNTVQVFNSSGTLQASISCASCPGGAFISPASVAIGPANSVYVVDLGTDRVVKFTRSGNSYVFASVIQSGMSAVAVAVDPATGEIFVGDLPGGINLHIVAYDASGTQFDDFAHGIFPPPPFGPGTAAQIAVNATTRKLYVTEPGVDTIRVFERVIIGSPTATTNAASPVGQIVATLKATVNAKKHGLTDCDFQYVDEADFLVNDYTNAVTVPCSSKPGGSLDTAVSAAISGLDPNTTYRYKVLVENNGGAAEGGDQTFTTQPLAQPMVTTEAATGIAQNAATLMGKVNPKGGTVSTCRFDYGTTPSYGKSSNCPTSVGPVMTDVAQKLGIKDLTPETTYHYRLVVTTNAGTVNGDDVEFTTSAVPPPPPPPPPPSGGGSTPSDPSGGSTTPPTTTPPKSLKCKKGFVKKRVRGKVRCVKKKRPSKRRRG